MKLKNKINYFFIIAVFVCSGCMRFSAGYFYQGAKDEAPKTKQINLDTQRLVTGSKDQANIEISAS